MYHICPAGDKQFIVVLLNEKNREVLSTSELLNSKQKAFENVISQLEASENPFADVQDDTLKKIIVHEVGGYGRPKRYSSIPPTARYVVKGKHSPKTP